MTDNDRPPDQEQPGQPGDIEPAVESEPEGGPLARERAFLEERLSLLRPVQDDELDRESASAAPAPPNIPFGELAEESDHDLAGGRPDRTGLIREYRQRQQAKLDDEPGAERREIDADRPEDPGDDNRRTGENPGEPPAMALADPPPPQPPAQPPADNWIPIGPSVLCRGQGGTQPPTSGRVVGISVAPGGARVYVAAANGGVWRSDDAGDHWHSLMEAWDLNPMTASSDSLACGAIAIVPGPPDRVYVGSGEGDGGAYFGVGPIVSPDGGVNWGTEPVAPGSPALAGSAFYALAVDPADGDRVVAGTRRGIYRREPDGSGGFHWAQKTLGGPAIVPSVVVARQGTTTTFYAARWSGPVFMSTDGHAWSPVGTGFPTENVGRVGVVVQPGNPGVVYALAARADNNHLHGLYRLDRSDGVWRPVTGVPAVIFGSDPLRRGQGSYDLVVAVDPNNVNRVYLGGATVASGGDWSAALYRGDITVVGTSVGIVTTYIGNSVHADVHALTFAPGDSNTLWVGCDGGAFCSTSAGGTGDIFRHRNAGLATQHLEHLGQHPTEDAVLFCGSQDNGGQRFTGEESWLYSSGGDAGFQLVNWRDPYQVLSTYVFGSVRRSTNGGARYSYLSVNVPLVNTAAETEAVLFYAPIAGTPRNPVVPAEADVVAFGSIRPWISTSFGGGWTSIPTGTLAGDRLNERIRSLAFASANRLYAGTMAGGVYRFDRGAAGWTRTQINTIGGAAALPLAGVVTDIVVDPSDATGLSIYITFGGTGDYRHVWHFSGSQWRPRSGPAAGHVSSLLDVQANALAVDPINPGHLYLGADIGAWRSTDGGAAWETFSEGLPDSAVMDLAMHGSRRLLRAATHGRSAYERMLDPGPRSAVELYVRDTQLDQGRFPTVNGLPDPTRPGETVVHYRGPDIKLDTPDVNGRYQAPVGGAVDFLDFNDRLTDDFRNVATHATAVITTRVYVQVHNRGIVPADNVRVMLLLANASAGLPALPPGYDISVRSGTPITTPDWRTIGFANLNDVRPGAPKIASFDLTSNLLPPPANLAGNQHHCVLALVHHADDPFTAIQTATDALSIQERKSAHKNLTVVQFTGTLPSAPLILPVRLNNANPDDQQLAKLQLVLRGYPGPVRLCLPPVKTDGDIEQLIDGGQITQIDDAFRQWGVDHIKTIKAGLDGGRPYDPEWSEQRIDDVSKAMDSGLAIEATDSKLLAVDRIVLAPAEHMTAFLVFERPEDAEIGTYFDLDVQQLDSALEHRLIGGITARIEIVPDPKDELRPVPAALTGHQVDVLEQLAVERGTDVSAIIRGVTDVRRP